jgi:adenosylcobinamide kinase/adenosylcobinamide-phosphate guanylyltransferase
MRQRIENHKKNRPPAWTTLETPTGVGREILQKAGSAEVVIIDCVTLLVSNILGRHNINYDKLVDTSHIEDEVAGEINGIIDCSKQLDAAFIIVTNEVGMDLVPANRAGRLYRDLLGGANQVLAGYADSVYLMVAGIPARIKPETG